MPDCNETPADTERMQTKFEYSAEGTNNAAKIPHQMPLFTKQHENINTSKERLKNQPQYKDIALSQTKRKDKPKQIRKDSEQILLYFPIQVKTCMNIYGR